MPQRHFLTIDEYKAKNTGQEKQVGMTIFCANDLDHLEEPVCYEGDSPVHHFFQIIGIPSGWPFAKVLQICFLLLC